MQDNVWETQQRVDTHSRQLVAELHAANSECDMTRMRLEDTEREVRSVTEAAQVEREKKLFFEAQMDKLEKSFNDRVYQEKREAEKWRQNHDQKHDEYRT